MAKKSPPREAGFDHGVVAAKRLRNDRVVFPLTPVKVRGVDGFGFPAPHTPHGQ